MWLREYFHMFPNYRKAVSFLGCRLEMRSSPFPALVQAILAPKFFIFFMVRQGYDS